MKKTLISRMWFVIGLGLILFSCQDRQQTTHIPNRDGLVNNLDNDKDQGEVGKILDSYKLQVDIYELDYDNREFPGRNGYKRKNRVSQKKEMYYFDFLALKSIINDSSSYTTFGSACFYPNIGVVIYDEESTILSELYICMHCNNYELYDSNGTFIEIQRDDGKYGFSERVRSKMRNIVASYGFETKHSYSIFYDYADDYLQNQIRNGRDSMDVVNEILEYNADYENGYAKKSEGAYSTKWKEQDSSFFDAKNIGKVVYEYYDTGGDKFTSYLGELEVNDSVFYVCNVFRRVQAAIVLHGHSSLFFLNKEKEIVAEYSMSFPDELPKEMNQNQLKFIIKGNTYFVDSVDFTLPYLCIAENVLCVPKIR